MTMLLLLLLFLDLQHPPLPDLPLHGFTVTNVKEQTLHGCIFTPSDGGNNNIDLTVEWADSFKDQTVQPLTFTIPPDIQIVPCQITMCDHCIPTPPEKPKPTATPEPPTIAILSITGLVLLYLIFGHLRRKGLSR
jgi:hypothetical protein